MADTEMSLVPYNKVREAILTPGFIPDYTDPEEIARQLAERLLVASSAEELFSVAETVKVTDILGETFSADSAQFMRSDYTENGGLGVYALVHGHSEKRGGFVVACGGRNVVVQTLRAMEEGWFPRWVRFEEAGAQKANRNRPLYLVMAEDPTTAVKAKN